MMWNFDFVQKIAKDYEAGIVSKKMSPNDSMNNQWYFDAGRSAIEVIIAACMASNVRTVRNVLDLPCGHGRVLRHLVTLFPDAEFDVCDVDIDGVDFCASTFGAKPIYSNEELTDIDFSSHYDIIWVGSLFTHTNRDIMCRWLRHLSNFLRPQGIIIATLYGRWSQYVHEVAPYINEKSWAKILKSYQFKGYGYSDYLTKENHDYISGSYGISMIKPHITISDIENLPGMRIYLYAERAWVDHQDVVVFGRPSYDELWPIMKGKIQKDKNDR